MPNRNRLLCELGLGLAGGRANDEKILKRYSEHAAPRSLEPASRAPRRGLAGSALMGSGLAGSALVAVTLAVGVLTLSSTALAEELPQGSAGDTPPPPRPAPGAEAPIVVAPPAAGAPAAAPPGFPRRARSLAKRRGPKPAASGFQAAFGTGVSAPVGDATDAPGDSLAARYAWQIPLTVDLGMKASERVYIGGYLQLAFGGEGSDHAVENACDDNDSNLENDVSCNVTTVRLGVAGEYSFEPDARWNPWVGYGIGVEGVVQSINDRPHGREETNDSTGFTFAKLSFGATHRGAVGLAPFIEVVASQFTKTTTRINGNEVHSGPVDDAALHAWILVGLKLVVNP